MSTIEDCIDAARQAPTMLASHERALTVARERGEPAGQLAARELEIGRISAALRRAEELASDVAEAIEREADLTPFGRADRATG